MSEPKDPTHEAYQRARDAFDELNIEKKATFLVEAAVSTLARGLASASEALGSEFERAFETMEAEAAAELLDPNNETKKVKTVTLTYPVDDVDALMERLLSDRNVSRVQPDPSRWTERDEPPPKGSDSLAANPSSSFLR